MNHYKNSDQLPKITLPRTNSELWREHVKFFHMTMVVTQKQVVDLQTEGESTGLQKYISSKSSEVARDEVRQTDRLDTYTSWKVGVFET